MIWDTESPQNRHVSYNHQQDPLTWGEHFLRRKPTYSFSFQEKIECIEDAMSDIHRQVRYFWEAEENTKTRFLRLSEAIRDDDYTRLEKSMAWLEMFSIPPDESSSQAYKEEMMRSSFPLLDQDVQNTFARLVCNISGQTTIQTSEVVQDLMFKRFSSELMHARHILYLDLLEKQDFTYPC